MHCRGQAGGVLGIQSLHNVVADQDCAAPGGNAVVKGLGVPALQLRQAPGIPGNAHMGIGVVSVAGEMLHHRRHSLLLHGADGPGDKLPGNLRGLAQRALIHKGTGFRGNIADRGHIHVDAQPRQKLGLLRLGGQHRIHAPLAVQLPGRGKGAAAKGSVAADPGHGAPLFVHRNQQGKRRRCLIALDFCAHGAGRFSGKVPAEEQQPAQAVLHHRLCCAGLRAPGQKHLAHLLLQREPVQQHLHRVLRLPGLGGRLGRRKRCRGLGSRR